MADEIGAKRSSIFRKRTSGESIGMIFAGGGSVSNLKAITVSRVAGLHTTQAAIFCGTSSIAIRKITEIFKGGI